MKLIDQIKDDVIEASNSLHEATEDLESFEFELFNMSLDDILANADDADELLGMIKKQRREFDVKLKTFEASMKKLRDFF
jgi:hypothetical protein